MLEIKKPKCLINVFEDITSICRWIESTPRRERAEDSSVSGSSSFTGTKSFEEAVELMRYGDEESYQNIKKQRQKLDLEKLIGNSIVKKRQKNDIVGQIPNVPNFLTGNPLSMINFKNSATSQKVINIVVNFTASARISQQAMRDIGVVYVNVIDLLEKLNYRCNVYLGIGVDTGYCDNNIYFLTKIKTDKEPLNIKKVAFTLTNPSMFRRIGFAWIERCNYHDSEVTRSGYGRPVQDYDRYKRDISNYLKEDFVILSFQNEGEATVEKVIEELRKKGIKIDV